VALMTFAVENVEQNLKEIATVKKSGHPNHPG
jgi:hypothetical protein